MSDIVKQGYLRYKSRSLCLWQKRWIILRGPSNKGPCRLEKYADERAARCAEQPKVQLLSSISNVNRISSRKHSFAVELNDGTEKCFSCDSELEADNWVKLITQECLIPSSGIASGEPDVLTPGIQKELQEQFRVYLMPSSKLEIFGECLLQVTHENIYLWDVNNTKVKLCAWPLTSLRRYGSDLTKFTFEAGRHCATGEGMFIFHTLEGEKIYRKVHQATLAIAEAHQRMKKLTTIPPQSPSLQSNVNSFKSANVFNGTSNNGTERISWYHSDAESTHSADESSGELMYNHQRSMPINAN